ncbi:hypothetical protein B843_07290 [Corynebacterium vitaeruminis DSM 20294]|uniref:Uncharacterized protein n=1 Tax=Corynebacterium vitaeruminis DSM 20294 TaxID=1224164 RepID=W5Y8M5_9CORY|nr:hypothetical protein B843_07290 [Corynebacterium vitaeruminis DSM 20294]
MELLRGESRVLLHRIIVDMVATDDGDMAVEIETQGNPPFVMALGMLDLARDEMYRRIDDED